MSGLNIRQLSYSFCSLEMRTFSGIHCVFTLAMSHFGRCTLKFLSKGLSSPQEFRINHWFWFERFKLITFFLVYTITGSKSLHFILAAVSRDEGTRGFNDNECQSLFSRLLRRTTKGGQGERNTEAHCKLITSKNFVYLSSKVRQRRTRAKGRKGRSLSRFP